MKPLAAWTEKTLTVCLTCAVFLFLMLFSVHASSASDKNKQTNDQQNKTAASEGSITTLWPLFDYRSSPATGYSNLSILGPIFKREQSGSTTKTAIRPFFFSTSTSESTETDVLYPIASTSSDNDSSDSQILRLYQRHASRIGTAEQKEETMLFPFYISGVSEKHGSYSSFFPFYGDIYERFWRDEYHYTLFPLYGRTVKNGTTSSNYLYPLFSTISGQNETGFQLWPLYGQAEKAGVYDKRFIVWPFFSMEHSGKNSENPTESMNFLPFYSSSHSPQRTATYLPWPFTGTVRDASGKVIERDYIWPFWMTASGKDSRTERYLPFYAKSKIKDTSSIWVAWPFYHQEVIDSPEFKQDKTSLLYFFFSRSDESWTKTGKDRSRSSMWPLYAWKRDEEGKRTLSFPALLEPVVWNEGVERNWAPLWRLFISTWDDNGNAATSILWNLFWHERRGKDVAWELSPLFSYSSQKSESGFRVLKGLFGYDKHGDNSSITILWLTFGGGAR